MRLLIAVDSHVWGGAEACVGHLLHELPERFEVTVLATRPVPEPLVRAARRRGTLVEVEPVRGKVDLPRLLAVRRAVARARPQLVHVNQSAPTNNRHVLGLALLAGLPTVPVLHLWNPLLGGLQDRLLQRAYRRAPRVVTVSAELREHLVDLLGAGPERVRVVPNGVAALPPATGSGRDAPLRIGALGRLVHHKGFDVLVEAVRGLTETGGRVEVVVAGDGPDRSALEAAARGLPVTLVGAVDDGPGFLAGLDLFVLPSRAEGLPLALLEAMTAGLPCVATDVGDVRQAVEDAALVVPPGDAPALRDALAALVLDPQERRRLGLAAREVALRRHTAARTAAAMAAVYDEVVGSGSSQPAGTDPPGRAR